MTTVRSLDRMDAPTSLPDACTSSRIHDRNPDVPSHDSGFREESSLREIALRACCSPAHENAVRGTAIPDRRQKEQQI